MRDISKRAKNTIFSPIRKFAPLVAAAEREGVTVYKLSSGDPDLTPPREFWTALKKYPSRIVPYGPSGGMPGYTASWVRYYRRFGVRLEPHNIIPTSGCAEAILFALQAVADPGDEILVFEPVYVSYRSFATMTGITLVPVHLPLETNFALPPARDIERKVTKKTRGIVIVNPDNPTGKTWRPAELAAIVRIAKKHDLFIIADETYREIRFRGRPSTLLANHAARERIIVADSASKRFSLPGARMGCIVSYNDAVMEAALKFAQARLSVGALEQWALEPLLANAAHATRTLVRDYRARRDATYRELMKIPGVVCHRPDGAFYLYARLPVDSAEAFVKFMVAEFRHDGETVLVAPMRDFYITPGLGENEIRIAYVLPPAKLARAVRILRLGLDAYRGGDASRDSGESSRSR